LNYKPGLNGINRKTEPERASDAARVIGGNGSIATAPRSHVESLGIMLVAQANMAATDQSIGYCI